MSTFVHFWWTCHRKTIRKKQGGQNLDITLISISISISISILILCINIIFFELCPQNITREKEMRIVAKLTLRVGSASLNSQVLAFAASQIENSYWNYVLVFLVVLVITLCEIRDFYNIAIFFKKNVRHLIKSVSQLYGYLFLSLATPPDK